MGKFFRGLIFVWEYIILRKILYEFSFRANLPKLSAHILCLLTKSLNDKKIYTVFCLGRSQFENDIRAILTYSDQIQYLYLHKILIGKIVRYFIPFDLNLDLIPAFRGKKDYLDYSKIHEDGFTYHIDPRYENGKIKVYKYLKRMFPILKKKLKFDAILSGNHIYVDQQEFFKICEENNTPGIILSKEGIGWGHNTSKEDTTNSGLRFMGSKILYLNKNYMNYEIKTLLGLNKQKTTLVGLPRFDFYVNGLKNDNKQIVLFSFILDEYLNQETINYSKDKLYTISDLFQVNVMRFALIHPDYKVIIKTRDPEKYLNYPNELYDKHIGKKFPKNLSIINRANPEHLILNSKAVLGFNSTVLIEALVANKMIITPDFRELTNDKHTPGIFRDFEDLINQENDYNAIENIILNNDIKTAINEKRKKEFLEPLIYKYDGESSNRVEEEIINSIIEKKTKLNH